MPHTVIEIHYDLTHPMSTDRSRIGQLFSNLVGNALTHGAADPVRVRAKSDGRDFELVVSNAGVVWHPPSFKDQNPRKTRNHDGPDCRVRSTTQQRL